MEDTSFLKNDHDLIVTLLSEVRQLQKQLEQTQQKLEEMGDKAISRIDALEETKLDKADFLRDCDESGKIHSSHSDQIKQLQIAVLGTGLSVLGVAAFLAIEFFNHLTNNSITK